MPGESYHGDSGLSGCCVHVTTFERKLSPFTECLLIQHHFRRTVLFTSYKSDSCLVTTLMMTLNCQTAIRLHTPPISLSLSPSLPSSDLSRSLSISLSLPPSPPLSLSQPSVTELFRQIFTVSGGGPFETGGLFNLFFTGLNKLRTFAMNGVCVCVRARACVCVCWGGRGT